MKGTIQGVGKNWYSNMNIWSMQREKTRQPTALFANCHSRAKQENQPWWGREGNSNVGKLRQRGSLIRSMRRLALWITKQALYL